MSASPTKQRYYFVKGRVALFALLKTFGISTGERVLMPGYTCIVVPLAVKYLGAIPEYADIDAVTYNSSLATYRAAFARLEAAGKASSLRALVLQHTYGAINDDSQAIVDWAHSKGLIIIEDCAHVWLEEPSCGSFGDAAFYSSQWSKPLTTGLGGIAVLNDERYRQKLEAVFASTPRVSLREALTLAVLVIVHSLLLRPNVYSLLQSAYRLLSGLGILAGSSSTAELQGEIPEGYFRRMHPLQIRTFERRERRMAAVQHRRRELAKRFDELLKERRLRLFQRSKDSVLIRYPVLVNERDQLLAAAKRGHIPLGDWFNHPLHPLTANLEGLNWRDADCPVAVETARAVVNLPLDVRLTDDEALQAVELVASQPLLPAGRSAPEASS